jgi:hypothetical protein
MGIDTSILVDSSDGSIEQTSLARGLGARRNRRRLMSIFGSRAEIFRVAPMEIAHILGLGPAAERFVGRTQKAPTV